MNKIGSMAVKTIITLIVLAGGAKLAYDFLKKHFEQDPDFGAASEEDGKASHAGRTPKPSEGLVSSGKNSFYSSVAKGYLDKYRLDIQDKNSIYRLFPLLQNDGKRFFLTYIKHLLEEALPPEQLVDAYKTIAKTDISMDIKRSSEQSSTPIVSKAALDGYFIDHELQVEAEHDLINALFLLFDKEYSKGKNREIEFFKVNFTWLEKYIENKDETKIAKELISIAQKINEEEALLAMV